MPQTVYRILTKTMSPIKGHDSNDEEVVGIMKNLLLNIIHGIPINFHDFFMRTLANIAMSPFELKLCSLDYEIHQGKIFTELQS